MRPVPFAVIGYRVFIMFHDILNRAEGSMEANAMTSHDPNTLLQYCDRGAVFPTFYDSITEVTEVHHRLQSRAA